MRTISLKTKAFKLAFYSFGIHSLIVFLCFFYDQLQDHNNLVRLIPFFIDVPSSFFALETSFWLERQNEFNWIKNTLGKDFLGMLCFFILGGFQWFMTVFCLFYFAPKFLSKSKINYSALLGGWLFFLHTLVVWIAYGIDEKESMNKAFYLGWSFTIAIIDWPVTFLMMKLGIPSHPLNAIIFGGLQWFLIGWLLGWIGIKLTQRFLKSSVEKS